MKGGGGCSLAHPDSPVPFTPQEPDARTLSRARGALQQLHVAYSGLGAGLQGLGAEHQERLGRARQSLCELYGLVAAAASRGPDPELTAEHLLPSHERVRQAWQGLEQLLDGLQQCPPLGWLVGPFATRAAGQPQL